MPSNVADPSMLAPRVSPVIVCVHTDFPLPGLTHDAEGLAALHLEGDASHGVDDTVIGVERHSDIVHLEESHDRQVIPVYSWYAFSIQTFAGS